MTLYQPTPAEIEAVTETMTADLTPATVAASSVAKQLIADWRN